MVIWFTSHRTPKDGLSAHRGRSRPRGQRGAEQARALRKPAFGVAIITPIILVGAVGASGPSPVAPIRDSAVTQLAAVEPSPGSRTGASRW